MSGRPWFALLIPFTAALALAQSAVSPSHPKSPPPTNRASTSAPSMTSVSAPTFSKDVAPILQKNCQVCHRPGEAGPFSMLTYEQTRPWAMAMKVAVQTGKMPPWFADHRYGKFSNAMSLSSAEIGTLA